MTINPKAWLTYFKSKYPNFHVVVPGRLYRSATPKPEDLEKWHALYGIETWLDLRMPKDYRNASFFAAQCATAARLGIKRISLPLDDFGIVSDEQVRVLLEILTNKDNGVILFGCKGNRHRGGLAAALYRTRIQGWTGEKAYEEEAKGRGYYASGHGKFDYRFKQLLGLAMILVMFASSAFGQAPKPRHDPPVQELLTHPFIQPTPQLAPVSVEALKTALPPKDDRFNWTFWLGSISYSYATAMDIAETKKSIDRGSIELNPIFGHDRGHKVRYTANAIASAGIYAVAVYAERKGHRLFARVLLFTGAAIRGAAAIWNHRRKR